MKKVRLVLFKKRDVFLILVILFMVAVGIFGGSIDSEDESETRQSERK